MAVTFNHVDFQICNVVMTFSYGFHIFTSSLIESTTKQVSCTHVILVKVFFQFLYEMRVDPQTLDHTLTIKEH